MNRILLVGNGAREHAMAEALTKNSDVSLYSFMNKLNPGIKRLSAGFHLGDLNDKEGIVEYAKSIKTELAVIGPEDPLSVGIVDELEKIGVQCASPNKEMSRIEWSKTYTRNLMKEKRIPGCPEFFVFSDKDNEEEIEREIKKIMMDLNNQVAIKPDYLTGGKGVKIWGDHLNSREEVIQYVKTVLSKGNKTVIVEEKLRKPSDLKNSEFTLQAFISGKNIVPTPLVQDFKRAYDADKGPNTGSMGSYSCSDHNLPFLQEKDYKKAIGIMKKTAEALKNYKGVLYGQFMLTESDVKLIEYNSRFGDPEAMNVLPLLKDDFLGCCEQIIDGNLTKKSWLKKASVCVYLTPKGYPIEPRINEELVINDLDENGNCKLFFASINEAPDGRLFTTSSRSIGILGLGNSIKEARRRAYNGVTAVSGELHFRSDIAEGI